MLSLLLHPVLPERTAELWRRLGGTPAVATAMDAVGEVNRYLERTAP